MKNTDGSYENHRAGKSKKVAPIKHEGSYQDSPSRFTSSIGGNCSKLGVKGASK